MLKTHDYFKQALFYLLLSAYILLMAKSLLFKQVSPAELLEADRMISRTVNLIPFQTIWEYTHFNVWIALMNVAGNVILFIPLGLYLKIYQTNKSAVSCVAVACGVSLCVEAAQYIFGLGSADIDDVILNTLGGLLGVCVYRVLFRLLKDDQKTKDAVTCLFCLAVMGIGACYAGLILSGYRVRIF